jgi:hypothetical protein
MLTCTFTNIGAGTFTGSAPVTGAAFNLIGRKGQ